MQIQPCGVFAWSIVFAVGVAAIGADSAQAELTTAKLEVIWDGLGREDEVGAQQAYDSIRTLARFPRVTVDFFRLRVRPVLAPDRQRLRQWIADLNSPVFARRAAASNELEKLGPLAGPALRRELQRHPPLEVVRRINTLLKVIEDSPPSSADLQAMRAVEALEMIDTSETRKLLEKLAGGAKGSAATCRAKAALDRRRKAD
jgi:hypothetical protein